MRGYWLAVAASIVAMLPAGPSFLPGLAIGIWRLLVLAKPEVRAAFPRTAVDLSKQGKWNVLCIAALPFSLVAGLMSVREIDGGDEVRDRIIWAAAAVLSVVLACIGLWQHSRYQGMRGKGLGITALVISFAAIVAFFVTMYYPVRW
jgi:hypothetical protein